MNPVIPHMKEEFGVLSKAEKGRVCEGSSGLGLRPDEGPSLKLAIESGGVDPLVATENLTGKSFALAPINGAYPQCRAVKGQRVMSE